jgi:GTP cyclohydrolase I
MTQTHTQVAGLALAEQPASGDLHRRIDHEAVQRAARDLLQALGADVDSEALEDTPRRVADAYAELLTPQPFRATTFPNDDGYDELIVARAIPFTRCACITSSRFTGWRTWDISRASGSSD